MGPSERVVLYVRDGCHLCEIARGEVARACEAAGVAWREADVDADAVAHARYSDLVPAVVIDGALAGYWRVDAGELAARLRGT